MIKRFVPFVLILIMLASCMKSTPAPVVTQNVPTATSGDTHAVQVDIASKMAGILYNMETIQKNTNDDTTAMALVTIDTSTISWLGGHSGKLASPQALPLFQIENVPQGFLDPLPTSGAIPGEVGSCGAAAANPSVTFSTAGGQNVTPQLLIDKNIQTIPTKMVTLPQTDPNSIFAKIDSMVTMGDPRLATSQGWNDLLWDQLKSLQKPAESLMDYQLWNASPEIEQQVTDLYLARLTNLNAPSIVINAYNASNKTGWYTNTIPTPEDALASLDIEAVMSGSIEGTVYEHRDFSIPGAGQTPIYGPQTGEGTVTWNVPNLGVLNFEVNILLDQFDERGHAVGGNVTGIDTELGYEVRFTFLPDGTRKGELLHNAEVVGLLTMSVDEDQFENYVSVQTNESEPLPLP
jgi:hypothetical protein